MTGHVLILWLSSWWPIPIGKMFEEEIFLLFILPFFLFLIGGLLFRDNSRHSQGLLTIMGLSSGKKGNIVLITKQEFMGSIHGNHLGISYKFP